MRHGLTSLITAVLAAAVLRAGTGQALDLAALLDSYAAGRHDETVSAIRAASDEAAQALRLDWPIAARRWIDARPEDRRRRMLIAASLALETENLRAERGDWVLNTLVCETYRELAVPVQTGAGNCVLQWAYSVIMERITPDEAERAWLLAAAALAGGVRDRRLLHVPPYPPATRTQPQGLMDRALSRFPHDVALRLEQAIASAARFDLVVDGGRGTSQSQPIRLQPRAGEADAAAMLAALADDGAVGPEANLRLGYLHWVMGRDQEAAAALTDAAARAADRDLKYTAEFLLGWTALQRGDLAAARAALAAALATRPHAQSAAVAVAAIDLKEGEAARAYDRARASLDDKAAADDPWRFFLYAHHPQLSARIAELRSKLR